MWWWTYIVISQTLARLLTHVPGELAGVSQARPVTPSDEMPSAAQLTDACRDLIDRSHTAGLLTTAAPREPKLADDPRPEGIRMTVSDRMRTAGHHFVGFDAANRPETGLSRLDRDRAAPTTPIPTSAERSASHRQ